MALEELIATYGYAAVVIGTFLEGETILVLAGFAAHRGYLDLNWVIVCAFAGTLLGDQLYYHVGRSKGAQFLRKRPGWQRKSEKVFALLSKHQLWLIVGFRFLYGLRTVTPFLIGMAQIHPVRFLSLNVVGALLWAVVVAGMGYLFGHALELVIGDIKRYELLLFGLLSAGGVAVWAAHRLRKNRPERG